MKYLNLLLLAIPLSVYLEITHANPAALFLVTLVSIIPLAAIMGRATEELAVHTGPRKRGWARRGKRKTMCNFTK